MERKRIGRYALGGVMVALLLVGTAGAETTIEQLQAKLAEQQRRLDAQEARISQLVNHNEADWMTERRVEQIKRVVHEVLADAETRAALLNDAIIAGHDGGFFLASEDGNHLLRIKGMLQTRYITNHQNDGPDDDHRGGFEISRTRFGFMGHVIDPSWKFLIWTGHHKDGDTLLLDAYLTKVLNGQWSVTAGQFKVPLWREWLVSETRQQFVARSLLNAFAGSYTQGVKVDFKDDALHVTLSINDGVGGINKTWDTEDTELALTGRVEWLVFGDWKQYSDWESWRGGEAMLVLGTAAHYQLGESGTATVESDIARWTADAHLELGGANLFAAVITDHVDNGVDVNRVGVLVQGGVFVTDNIEIIGRFEWADLDEGADDTLSVVTAGFNYFFAQHRAKLTVDVGYGFEPVPSTMYNTFAGWRMDSVGEDGQVVGRAQMQLLF